MTVRTTAGSTLRITNVAPASFDATGYAAIFPMTPTSANPFVGEITNLGEFGREYAEVTHNPIGTRSTQKFKGSYQEGSLNLELGLDTDDAGQIMMKAALMSDLDYYFEVKTQNGDRYYFPAKTMSFKVNLGSVDQITTASVTLGISSAANGVGVVETLAA